MIYNLKGKVVLVTGASGDIGEACAEAFLKCGASVILHTYKNIARVNKLAKKFPSLKTYVIQCDATNESEVKEQFEVIKKKYKIKRIDGLVNVAGDLLDRIKIEDMKWEFANRVLEVNTKSAFLFTSFCLPLMPKNSSIVFVSSLTARCGKGDRSSAYGLSKGALISWSKCLANELGPRGIRVNCLTPGYILGQFHHKYTSKKAEIEHKIKNPLRRLGVPEDVADAALFYIANSKGYISGTTLDICGADYMC